MNATILLIVTIDKVSNNKIWVDLHLGYNYEVIAYRLDDGTKGRLKGNALKKAEQMIDIYQYHDVGYFGVYNEIEIDEFDFIPINAPLEIDAA